jgi:hypothetical protein
MTRTKLILSIVSIYCLLFVEQVHSQDSAARARESRLQLSEAEFDIRMHELEYAVSKHAVDEAAVELEKLKLRIELVDEQGKAGELALAKLELKKAEIRIEMQELQTQMARLKIDRVKSRLRLMRGTLNEKPKKPTPVRFEYIDGSDVIVIQGSKKSVDRVKALIEAAAKENKK